MSETKAIIDWYHQCMCWAEALINWRTFVWECRNLEQLRDTLNKYHTALVHAKSGAFAAEIGIMLPWGLDEILPWDVPKFGDLNCIEALDAYSWDETRVLVLSRDKIGSSSPFVIVDRSLFTSS